MKRNPTAEVLLTLALFQSLACQKQIVKPVKPLKPPEQQTETRALPANRPPDLKLAIDGAVDQIGKTISYDASYQKIDHRRVPNLQIYFSRKGKSLSTEGSSETFLPGDIITWDLGGGADHVGMVVNVWYRPAQRYLIVHNIGAGTRMEDVLFAWKITGH